MSRKFHAYLNLSIKIYKWGGMSEGEGWFSCGEAHQGRAVSHVKTLQLLGPFWNLMEINKFVAPIGDMDLILRLSLWSYW